MLFNSFAFLGVFLPIVVTLYWVVRGRFGTQAGQGIILLASLFFYAYAKPSYLPLLLGSILFNWAMGVWMGTADVNADEGEAKRKRIMWLGIAVNAVFLCSFKYLNFFFRQLSFMGAHVQLPNWAAPLGISFFTFTQLMYLVDTSQGLSEPNSLFDHATLVSMFPYVIAGPLVRSSSIVPQFRETNASSIDWERGCRGLFLFTLGLAKKVIFADAFAHVADIGFNAPTAEYSTLEAWIFAVFYAFQMYYDFSGYSDMAVGCAWMLGIDIPQNFNRPYVSTSMSEFWTRWHISLSNFITNYLYTPILRGMGKATLATSVFAVIAAMFIAGLWHGAAWTFIIWGTLHGIALGVNQIWRRKKLRMPNWMGWALTFVFVVITLVFFRSTSVPAALHMLYDMLPRRNLLDDYAIKYTMPISALFRVRLVTVGMVAAFFFSTSQELAEKLRFTRLTGLAAVTLMLWSLLFMNSAAAKEFIYFAF